MGACCGGGAPKDEEIEKAQSIKEIAEVINNKRNKFPQEAREIQDFLKDPTKEVTFFNTKGLSPDEIKQRFNYMTSLADAFKKTHDILVYNPNLDLDETKNYVNEIVAKYKKTYDPNNELDKAVENFFKYAKEKNKGMEAQPGQSSQSYKINEQNSGFQSGKHSKMNNVPARPGGHQKKPYGKY